MLPSWQSIKLRQHQNCRINRRVVMTNSKFSSNSKTAVAAGLMSVFIGTIALTCALVTKICTGLTYIHNQWVACVDAKLVGRFVPLTSPKVDFTFNQFHNKWSSLILKVFRCTCMAIAVPVCMYFVLPSNAVAQTLPSVELVIPDTIRERSAGFQVRVRITEGAPGAGWQRTAVRVNVTGPSEIFNNTHRTINFGPSFPNQSTGSSSVSGNIV